MRIVNFFWNVIKSLLKNNFTKDDQSNIVDNLIKRKYLYNMENCHKKIDGIGHIIICNHLHALDALMIRQEFDGWVISKADLANGNLFYKVISNRIRSSFKSIPYERGNPESGELVKRAIMDKINIGENVIIFPEGNCLYNNQEGLKPLKKGIIYLSYENRVPMVMLTVWYDNPEFGQGERHPFSLRRTLKMRVSGELYFEEVVYPVDFGTFEEYYDYISETMNWNAIIKN